MTPEPSSPPETIAAAAIQRKADGHVFTLPPPARHHHLIDHIIAEGAGAVSRVGFGYRQGFVTSTGRFVERAEACVLARTAGQIKQKHGAAGTLYSEDVW